MLASTIWKTFTKKKKMFEEENQINSDILSQAVANDLGCKKTDVEIVDYAW